jgi:hypothetical protein
MFELNPRQQDYLSRNGFVVVPSHEYEGMDVVYEKLKDAELPVFVTTDALLHTAHLFFDYVLRIAEITALRPQLAALTDALLQASAKDLANAANAEVKEAARRNCAYFSVAARLLDRDAGTPPKVEDLVRAELALIDNRTTGNPPPKSPALGIREDYIQYVPRGHYTRNDDFRTYFLAAMWYGRMGFFLNPSESHDLNEAENVRLARQALLITGYLHKLKVDKRPAIDLWRGLYETTALFAGRAEDAGPDEYAAVAQEVWGRVPTLTQLGDDKKMGEFLNKARQLPRPRVLSTYYLSGGGADCITPDWRDGTLGFRMLAQRFVPDSHIFSELVWDRVGKYTGRGNPFTLFVSMYDGPYRAFPRGLDVLSVFGSELAGKILREEGDTEYAGYNEKLAALRAEYAKGDWERDLYHRWLGVLRALAEPADRRAPGFMQRDPWGRKQINAALGSWAELRHDTILYVKQSYTSVARGAFMEERPERHAFVEPCPEVFRRLEAMIKHLHARLGEPEVSPGKVGGTPQGPGGLAGGMIRMARQEQLGSSAMVPVEVSRNIQRFAELCGQLAGIAERELQGVWPTARERETLFGIGIYLKSLLMFPYRLMQQITSSTDDKMPVVADVHTHMEGGQVLEEAVGDPFLICVELQNGGQRKQYWGAVFSYYEFKHPMNDRLTDEAWQAMEPKPPLPPWTGTFVAGS